MTDSGAGYEPSSFEAMLWDLATNQRGLRILVNEIILESHRQALENILAAINRDDCDPVRRERIWNGLRAAGASDFVNARLLAIWCFARLRATAARHAIIHSLADPDHDVRDAAAKTLKGKVVVDDLDALGAMVDAAPAEVGTEATHRTEEIPSSPHWKTR